MKDGTYEPLAGELFEVQKQFGYWVSLKGFETRLNLFATHEPHIINDIAESYRLLALREKAYVGIWRTDTHVYFDLSEHFTNLKQAMIAAKQRNQKAIWDCANGIALIVPNDFIAENGKYRAIDSLSQERAQRSADLMAMKREKNGFIRD